MFRLVDYLLQFKQRKILVIGDIIADEFIIGQPQRISREAPVLILQQNENKILPGGGTNAANNAAALGGEVYLTGVIGDDINGLRLKDELIKRGIVTEGLITDPDRPTSVKTRILAGGDQVVKQQLVRVDNLETHDISASIEEKLLNNIEKVISKVEGVILSDYGNGVFTERVIERAIKMARKAKKVIAVDSRYQLENFKGMTIATPNKEETEKIVGFQLNSSVDVEEAGWLVKELLAAEAVLITLGGKGMQLFYDDRTKHIPASNYSEVFDVTGAGDTVIAAMLMALISGASKEDAMMISNYAAGIVVRKAGVATTTVEEIKDVLRNK